MRACVRLVPPAASRVPRPCVNGDVLAAADVHSIAKRSVRRGGLTQPMRDASLLAHSSEAPALYGPAGTPPLTHAALRQLARALDLAPWGVACGQRVALLMPNGACAAACLVASVHRYCALPMDVDTPLEATVLALRSRGARLVLSLRGPHALSAAHAAQAVGIPAVELVPISNAAGAFELPPPPSATYSEAAATVGAADATNSDRDVVLVVSTSGTDSTPKGVPMTLRRLRASAAAVGGSLQLGATDVGLNMLPLYHVAGIVASLLAPIVAGGAVVCCGRFDPELFFAEVGRAQPVVSWCHLVPSAWALILQRAIERPPGADPGARSPHHEPRRFFEKVAHATSFCWRFHR